MERNYLSRERHREDNFGFEGHHVCGWPARIYACSFCRREFRSAQALGGHMNVHRRDRARLRSALPSSSCLPESPKPKPNPNSALLSSHSSSSSSPLSDEVLPSALYSPCLTLSSTPSSATSEGKKPIPLSSQKLPLLSHQTKETKNTRRDFGIEELKGFAEEEENMVSKNCDNRITLELGIGLLQHPKDNIDLELRLGNF